MVSQRVELIADTAIRLLVERGMRGLTHRAVDEAAGLPPGSTSNYTRTRAALLAATLARLNELETIQFAIEPQKLPTDVKSLADLMAALVHQQLTEGRATTVARYELALEATRRPELRTLYDDSGRRYRDLAIALFTHAGSPDPVRHGNQMVAFTEGLLFDAIVGAGQTPTPEDLRSGLREILKGMLS